MSQVMGCHSTLGRALLIDTLRFGLYFPRITTHASPSHRPLATTSSRAQVMRSTQVHLPLLWLFTTTTHQ